MKDHMSFMFLYLLNVISTKYNKLIDIEYADGSYMYY